MHIVLRLSHLPSNIAQLRCVPCGSGPYPSWQEGNTALRGGQHLGFGVVRRYHRNSKMETAEQVLIQEDGAAAAQCIVAPS